MTMKAKDFHVSPESSHEMHEVTQELSHTGPLNGAQLWNFKRKPLK